MWRKLNGYQRREVERKVKAELRSEGEKVLAVQGNQLLVDAYQTGIVLTLMVTSTASTAREIALLGSARGFLERALH